MFTGSRDIGLVADKYDEFFYSEKVFSAVYSNDANRYAAVLSSAADYIKNPSAQSFLQFGTDPQLLTKKEVQKLFIKGIFKIRLELESSMSQIKLI